MSLLRTSLQSKNLTETDSEFLVPRQHGTTLSPVPTSQNLAYDLCEVLADDELPKGNTEAMIASVYRQRNRKSPDRLQGVPNSINGVDLQGGSRTYVAAEYIADDVKCLRQENADTESGPSTMQMPAECYEDLNKLDKAERWLADIPQMGNSGRRLHFTVGTETESPSAYQFTDDAETNRVKVQDADGSLNSRLIRSEKEREMLVYKLIQFVESNGHLIDQLEVTKRSHAELKTQLEERENQLADAQREIERLKSELKRHRCNASEKLLPNESSSSSSNAGPVSEEHKCREQMQQAVQMVQVQQQELNKMNDVIRHQKDMLSTLLHRNTGSVEHVQMMDKIRRPNSSVVSRIAATPKATDEDVGQKANPLQLEQLNIASRDRTGRSQRKTDVLAGPDVSVQLVRPPSTTPFNAAQRNTTGLAKTASVQQQAAPNRAVPMKYPPINLCPICSVPIPVEASSPDAFSLHVDECLMKITRDVAPPRPPTMTTTVVSADNAKERFCPVCRLDFSGLPDDEREQHVNNHFEPPVEEFVIVR